MNNTTRFLRSHRSIRNFLDEEIPEDHIAEAVACGQMASTSSAVQAYSLIRVRDKSQREQIADLCGPQEKVAKCGAFFVVCGDTRRQRLAARREGKGYDQGLEAFLVAAIDASLFAEKMVIAFESMGYGICYIGGLRNNIAQVDDILQTPEGVYPLYGLCVGVPDEDPVARPRLPLDAVLFDGAYPTDDEMLAKLAAYDEGYLGYLAARGSPAEPEDAWSMRMSGKYEKPMRPHLKGYYENKGARFV